MEETELNDRIARMRDPWWLTEEVEQFYGIKPQPQNKSLFDFLGRWAEDHAFAFEKNGTLNRHTLERFFVSSKAVPRRWMALQLGMTNQSLDQLIEALKGIQLTPLKFSKELVAESLKDDLLGLFNEFRFRILKDHNDWCQRLHDAIGKRFSLLVQKAECAVSKAMDECPTRYASTFDAITCQPLSTKYSVWLNFGKPMSLPPDRCSSLLYWQHHSILHPFLLGTREPEQLAVGTA